MSEKDRNVDKAVGKPPRTKLNRREKAMIRVYILADMNMRGPLKVCDFIHYFQKL